MSQLFEAMIAEMDQETEATRRVLEKVPADKLEWRPHKKSMTLGQLALHVARTPGQIAEIISQGSMDFADTDFNPDSPKSTAELLPSLEQGLATAREILGGMDDQRAMDTWKLKNGDRIIMEVPRVAFYRSVGLNHWYHHRAQLGVYLRLLDIPVPAVYGRSADEDPMTAAATAPAK